MTTRICSRRHEDVAGGKDDVAVDEHERMVRDQRRYHAHPHRQLHHPCNQLYFRVGSYIFVSLLLAWMVLWPNPTTQSVRRFLAHMGWQR
jgi:hypothetical protein